MFPPSPILDKPIFHIPFRYKISRYYSSYDPIKSRITISKIKSSTRN